MTNRILGIDYGIKRVGLALSDPLGIFASPLETLENHSEKKLLYALKQRVKQHGITLIVMGLPKRTSGELGDTALAVQAFSDKLIAATQLPLIYEDERFTSTIAHQSLIAMGQKPSRQKGLVDQTAAALILQQYLDKRARTP